MSDITESRIVAPDVNQAVPCYWCGGTFKLNDAGDGLKCNSCRQHITRYPPGSDAYNYGPLATLFPATKYFDKKMLQNWARYKRMFVLAERAMNIRPEAEVMPALDNLTWWQRFKQCFGADPFVDLYPK